MHALVFLNISQQTKYEVPSFTHSKDMIGVTKFNKKAQLSQRSEDCAMHCQLKSCQLLHCCTKTHFKRHAVGE